MYITIRDNTRCWSIYGLEQIPYDIAQYLQSVMEFKRRQRKSKNKRPRSKVLERIARNVKGKTRSGVVVDIQSHGTLCMFCSSPCAMVSHWVQDTNDIRLEVSKMVKAQVKPLWKATVTAGIVSVATMLDTVLESQDYQPLYEGQIWASWSPVRIWDNRQKYILDPVSENILTRPVQQGLPKMFNKGSYIRHDTQYMSCYGLYSNRSFCHSVTSSLANGAARMEYYSNECTSLMEKKLGAPRW